MSDYTSYFNMVESTKNEAKEELKTTLTRLALYRLKPETIEDDLLVMEMKADWREKDDKQKIYHALSEADVRILRWHKSLEVGESMKYEEWAQSLRKKFGKKKIEFF